MNEFDGFSDEYIKEISLEKNKKGNATARALKAQIVLWHRGGCSFQQYSHRADTARDDYNYGNPDKFTKRFK